MNAQEFKKATKGKKIIKQYFNQYKHLVLVFEDNIKYQVLCTYDDLDFRLVKKRSKDKHSKLKKDVEKISKIYYKAMLEKYNN
jgi:hypothetical protein